MLKRVLLSLIVMGTLLNATFPTEESVTKLYIATFDRAPDKEGLEYWLHLSGLDLEGIAMSFFDQQETKEKYPSGFSQTDFIQAIYKNLFQRDPDSLGFDYWSKELKDNAIDKSIFILAIINGAKGDDAKILDNKTQAGLAFERAGKSDIKEATELMVDITADESTISSALCKSLLSGCSEPIKEEIKEDLTKDKNTTGVISTSDDKDTLKDTKTTILRANDDRKSAQTGQSITVAVIDNDIIPKGETPRVKIEIHHPPRTQYLDFYDIYGGIVRVNNNQEITFTPNNRFNGGDITINYLLFDNNNHISRAELTITYPKVIYLEDDSTTATTIGVKIVDVLANDTLSSNLDLHIRNNNGVIDSSDEGEWTVTEDNKVKFTPNSSFGGGEVHIYYDLEDSNNDYISSAEVKIIYPKVLYAEIDELTASRGDIITTDVLANDTFDTANSPTVKLLEWSDGGDYIPTDSDIVKEDIGTWSVENNRVKFVPDSNFKYNEAYINYQISDDNYISSNYIDVTYSSPIKLDKDELFISYDKNPIVLDVLKKYTYSGNGKLTINLNIWSNELDSNGDLVHEGIGTWSIENNKIKFVPDSNFNEDGAVVYYEITDGTYTYHTGLDLIYPNN